MKKALLILLLFATCSTMAQAYQWHRIPESEFVYIDKKSQKFNPSKGVASGWVRFDHVEELAAISTYVVTGKYAARQGILSMEINCSDRDYRSLKGSFYSPKGILLYKATEPSEWEPIVYDTNMYEVYRNFCSAI